MRKRMFYVSGILAVLAAGTPLAGSVLFNIYVDDYGQFSIDGSLVGSYNNPAAAGNIITTLNLTPGWHDLSFDYKNQSGTNFLALQWQLPGDSTPSVVPLADLQSTNGVGSTVSGLRGDYYNLSGGYQFTVYGEGPIDNGALSFTSEIYEGVSGLWAGVYGPSALFEERLSGQIYIPAPTPEPSGLALLAIAAVLSAGWAAGRRRNTRAGKRA